MTALVQALQVQTEPHVRRQAAKSRVLGHPELLPDEYIESVDAVASIGRDAPREEPHERQPEREPDNADDAEPPHVDVMA